MQQTKHATGDGSPPPLSLCSLSGTLGDTHNNWRFLTAKYSYLIQITNTNNSPDNVFALEETRQPTGSPQVAHLLPLDIDTVLSYVLFILCYNVSLNN